MLSFTYYGHFMFSKDNIVFFKDLDFGQLYYAVTT